MTEADMIARAQAGDTVAVNTLVREYERYAYSFLRGFYLPGGDDDDLKQEALVGLFAAIRDYDAARGSAFRTFIALCVKRNIMTAVKTANRGYQRPLNEALRHATDPDEEGRLVDIVDLIPDETVDPALVTERRAELRDIARAIRVYLSPLEARALLGIANGLSYEAIADLTGDDEKQIDNAVQRARLNLEERRETRRVYVCPTCGHETVKKRKRGAPPKVETRGRPPKCNVCAFKAAA